VLTRDALPDIAFLLPAPAPRDISDTVYLFIQATNPKVS
jgi:hypothetical protein